LQEILPNKTWNVRFWQRDNDCDSEWHGKLKPNLAAEQSFREWLGWESANRSAGNTGIYRGRERIIRPSNGPELVLFK